MIVGIDLGTTNSLIGIWQGGAPFLISNALEHALTPSAVGLGDDGEVIVGLAARERLSTHPALTATAFKRYMGTDRQIVLGQAGYRPEELSALVLRSLKSDAEAHLGERIDEAVITVPAYFNDTQRKATKAAGELAGLRVNRLLTEPTAAALAYGLKPEDSDEMLLVVDLGGGTFDVSLLHRFEGVTEVRAAAGDSWLGGDDFVDLIVGAFMNKVGKAAGLPPPSADRSLHAFLRRQAELAKRRLSEADMSSIRLVHKGKELDFDLTREEFERISEPLLARLRHPIERAMRDARIDPGRISRVIMAGGASRMPMFRKLIGRLFHRLPLQTVNPDEVVARGAAIRAGMLMRDVDLAETVMTDVAPFTLGTGVRGRGADGTEIDNVFMPIIERNTVIPVSRMKSVVNADDNQQQIIIAIYQGESPFIDDNIRLGELTLPLPPARKGTQAVDIRFTYDPSGLLEVDALVSSTGVRQTLVIEGNPGVLTREQVAERLAMLDRLKIHPRDDTKNQTLLARGKRLYEEHLGAEREAVGQALVEFQAALEGQDPGLVGLARSTLEDVCAHLDDGFIV